MPVLQSVVLEPDLANVGRLAGLDRQVLAEGEPATGDLVAALRGQAVFAPGRDIRHREAAVGTSADVAQSRAEVTARVAGRAGSSRR